MLYSAIDQSLFVLQNLSKIFVFILALDHKDTHKHHVRVCVCFICYRFLETRHYQNEHVFFWGEPRTIGLTSTPPFLLASGVQLFIWRWTSVL